MILNETLVKDAVNQNIVAYDRLAEPGVFTKRLIALMKVIMRRNCYDRPIPPIPGTQYIVIVGDDADTNGAERLFKNVKIHKDPHFNVGCEVETTFKEHGHMYDANKTRICIMINNHNKVMLGLY